MERQFVLKGQSSVINLNVGEGHIANNQIKGIIRESNLLERGVDDVSLWKEQLGNAGREGFLLNSGYLQGE